MTKLISRHSSTTIWTIGHFVERVSYQVDIIYDEVLFLARMKDNFEKKYAAVDNTYSVYYSYNIFIHKEIDHPAVYTRSIISWTTEIFIYSSDYIPKSLSPSPLLYKIGKGFSTTALTEKTTEPIWLKCFTVIPENLLKVLVSFLLIKNKYKKN